MQVYILTSESHPHIHFHGAFETVRQAMEHVYWGQHYQRYRGYTKDFPAVTWTHVPEDNSSPPWRWNGIGLKWWGDGELVWTIQQLEFPNHDSVRAEVERWVDDSMSFDDWLDYVAV